MIEHARWARQWLADLPPDAAGRSPFVVLRIAGDGDVGNEGDALAADDVVVLPSPGRQRLPVFMVGEVPLSVARVFETDENVELFRTTLTRLAAALHAAYAGEAPKARAGCKPKGLDANEAFAKANGFNGTPVLVRASDGAVLQGYRPATPRPIVRMRR